MEQLSRGAVGLLTRQSIRWRDVPLPSRRLADETERIGFGQIVCVLDAKWQPVWSPPPLVRRRVGIGRPKPGPVRRRDLEAIPKTEFLEMFRELAAGDPGSTVCIDVQDGVPVSVTFVESAKS